MYYKMIAHVCFPPCAWSDDEKLKAFGLVWTD